MSEFRIGLAEDRLADEAEACILGTCKTDGSASSQHESADVKASSLWLELHLATDREHKTPPTAIVASLRAPIDTKGASQCSINVIVYTAPRAERMKYLSLEPMVLPTASSAGVLDRVHGAPYRTKGQQLQHKLECLISLDPLRHRDVTTHYQPNRGPGQGFRSAIDLVSPQWKRANTRALLTHTPTLQLNQCSYLNERLTSSKSNGHADPIQPMSLRISTAFVGVFTGCCQRAKCLLQLSVRGVAPWKVSATARQLDLRLGQFAIWPTLGYQLRSQRRKDQEPVSNLAPRYIALYNGVWLVANDVILGQAAGVWICDNHRSIARFLSWSLSPVLVDGLVNTLDWLDDWPAGFKLNTQLSHFFRDMFVGLTAAWNDTFLAPLVHEGAALSRLIYLVGLSSRLMGLTMLLSITVDILQLLTLHWTVFYRIQQAIFSFFCSSIISLFHLFRGKKRNPLRKNRIDQATYELDQLLLGTIFFTLFIFLWLTVAIYYLHFGLLRLALVGVIVILQTGLAFLNHLPLFALMLRLKEPARLPGGVRLGHFHVETSSNPLRCCYYELQNTPLGIQDIFRGYNGHLQAIRNLPGLLWCLCIGRKF